MLLVIKIFYKVHSLIYTVDVHMNAQYKSNRSKTSFKGLDNSADMNWVVLSCQIFQPKNQEKSRYSKRTCLSVSLNFCL